MSAKIYQSRFRREYGMTLDELGSGGADNGEGWEMEDQTMSHTPGPWTAYEDCRAGMSTEGDFEINRKTEAGMLRIGQVFGGTHHDGSAGAANARLIAAAPALLALLKSCLAYFENMQHSPITRPAAPDVPWMDPIYRAIKRAEGREG